jgi:hypothetical protein
MLIELITHDRSELVRLSLQTWCIDADDADTAERQNDKRCCAVCDPMM